MDMAVVCCGSLWSMVILLSVITVGGARFLLLPDTSNQNKQSEIPSSQIQRLKERLERQRDTLRSGGGASGSIRVWEGTLEWNENQQKQPWYWDTIVAVTDREQSRMQIECNAHTQRVTSNATFNCNEYENWNLIYAKHLLNNHLINEKCTIYKTHLHACNTVSNMQTAYKLSMKPVLSLNIINTWWMPTVGWLV